MLTNGRTAVAAAIILSAASAAAAKDGGPPTIDIQKTCRENVNELRAVVSGSEAGQDTSVCVMDEQAARDQLVKDWATYPAIAKARCAEPKEYLPGYVEWQSCLEMTRDVLKLRKESASSTSGSSASRRPSGGRAGAVTGDCPVVKYTDDGSIEYIINCPGVGLK